MGVNYVNESDIPESIFRALTDPYYSEGLEAFFDKIPEKVLDECEDRHYSVTQLSKSARQIELLRRHSDKITQDALKAWWKMFGHVVHSILENYPEEGQLTEQRVWTTVQTEEGLVLLHGQADTIHPKKGLVQDYKVTSALSMVYGAKESYHAQLNVLGWILSGTHGRYDPANDEIFIDEPGFAVEELENIFMFRHLEKHKIKHDDPTDLYPKKEVLTDSVEVWDDEKVTSYITDRLEALVPAVSMSDNNLPFCTKEERWERETVYKVYKLDPKTGKRQKISKKNSEVRMECEDWIAEHPADAKGKPINYEIVEVPGEPILCDGYCDIAAFCNQRQEELKQAAKQK